MVFGGLAGLLLAAFRSSRLGSAKDVTRLVPDSAVVKLRLRKPGEPGAKAWDPITTGVLGIGTGSVMIAPPDHPPGEHERAAADQLSAALRHHGRRAWVVDHSVLPADTVPVPRTRSRASTVLVTSDGVTSEPGSVLAALTGHVVLIVTPRTRRQALTEALHRIAEVGAEVQGVVLLTGASSPGGRFVPAVLRRSTS
jgi:hypothetical protein